jgi:histone chaperone ASF1
VVSTPNQATEQLILTHSRDSEDSAPAEYPPEQPEADQLDDDETRYGAEEAEMQAALEKELEETEALEKEGTGEDAAMGGVEPAKKEDDEASDAGSEDLEEESSDDDDEEDEEVEADDDMEMADGEEKPADGQATEKKPAEGKQPEVMVH